MNILITGSEGFIGWHLVDYLKERRYNVVGVDRICGKEVLDLSYGDLINIDIVVHLAAQTSVWNDNTEQIAKDNIQAFIHIFNLCKSMNKRFIYASSSCSVNVTSMYGLSKNFDDEYFKIYGWDECLGLRLHNVYGSGARPDTLLGMCINNRDVLLWNNGKNRRHFTYIDDVCEAIEKSFEVNGKEIYNVYNPASNSTLEFAQEVGKYIPLNISLTQNKRDYDKDDQYIDTSLRNLINHPTSIQNGIQKIFT